MISPQQQRDWFSELLARGDAALGNTNMAWLYHARDEARRRMAILPMPTRKQEAWRYNRIHQLFEHDYQPIFEIDEQQKQLDIQAYQLPQFDSYRLVFINGRCVSRLSDLSQLPAGITLGSLHTACQRSPKQLLRWFDHGNRHIDHPFTALNGALVNDGLFLHIDADVELDRPVEVIYFGQEVEASSPQQSDHQLEALLQTRNVVTVESGGKLTLVERFIGLDSSAYFHNNLSDISVADNAEMKHYRIQDESRHAYHLSSLYVTQQQHSRYHNTSLALGAAWSRTECRVHFQQPGSVSELNGLYSVGDQQLTDFHLDVRHSVPDCSSRERFKGILYGEGRAVFDGRILVEKQAQHSDAALTNDNLMLTRQAEVDTKPQLEIYADDVKCSHGTTVGRLDQQQVYYLRSRGIDEATAQRMLCLGFASDIINTIDEPVLREHVSAQVNKNLNQVEVRIG